MGRTISFKVRSRRENTSVNKIAGPVHAELVTVRETEDSAVRIHSVNKAPLPRVQMSELDHDSIRTELNNQIVLEKPQSNKGSKNKYVKYTNASEPSQNNPANRDLQWK